VTDIQRNKQTVVRPQDLRTSTPLRRPYPLNFGLTFALKGYSTSEYRYPPKRLRRRFVGANGER
jgi:hypothetical protein